MYGLIHLPLAMAVVGFALLLAPRIGIPLPLAIIAPPLALATGEPPLTLPDPLTLACGELPLRLMDPL